MIGRAARVACCAALLLAVFATDAEAQRRGRASRLRQPIIEDTPPPPPQVTDQAPEAEPALRAPTGGLDMLFLYERSGRRGDAPATAGVSITTALGARIFLPHGFSVNLLLRAEPIPALEGDNSRQPAHAAWIENFHLRWQQGPLILFAGKIHPRFSLTWQRAPGVHGADFAGDYELREKLGIGARLLLEGMLGLDPWLGRHSVQIEAFQADRLLSGGLFARRWVQSITSTDPATGDPVTRFVHRWQNDRALGSADNAEGLPGFVASLGGSRIALGEARFGYNVALSFRRPGEDASGIGRGRAERGMVAGVYGRVPLPGGIVAEPLIEAARQDSAGGFEGRRAEWLTAGLALTAGAITASHVVMVRRDADDVARSRSFAQQHTANVTLALGRATGIAALNPFSVLVDWRRLAEGGARSDGFAAGVMLSLDF